MRNRNQAARLLLVLLSVSAGLACRNDPDRGEKYFGAGSHPVGNLRSELHDSARSRSLRVEIWYPAEESYRAEAEAGHPVEEFLPEGPDRETYRKLLAEAPDPGPSRTAYSAPGAAPDTSIAPWPLVLFSHCMSCVRFAAFSIAERLASHGFAVAAPDHTGGTIFDSLAGNAAFLTPDFLETRAADMRFLLDTLLDAGAVAIPEAIRGRFDSSRVGIFGHSFGGATAGMALKQDARYKAGLAIAVPMASPLLPGVTMAEIHPPVLFLLAVEDNMIFEIGNRFIRGNFEDANPPAWMIEVADAGHMSFSDICRITENYPAGCGHGMRQTGSGEAFTYIDQSTGIDVARGYVTAFFSAYLRGEKRAEEYLARGRPEMGVEISHRAVGE